MDEQRLQDALEGKIEVKDLSDEEVPVFLTEARKAAEDEVNKVAGRREAKRDLESTIEELETRKKDLEENPPEPEEEEEEEEKKEPKDPRFDQLREENVQKAWKELDKIVQLSDEDRAAVKEKFSKLDSGKMDSELIFADLLSSLAAAKPDDYIGAKNKLDEMKKNAEQHNMDNAGSHNAPPSGDKKPKFSDEVMKRSKEAGIPPEAAERQLQEGMSRTLE